VQYAGWAATVSALPLCYRRLSYARHPEVKEMEVDGAWQRVAEVTTRGAGSVMRTLVRQGEAAAERAEQVVEELLAWTEADRVAITRLEARVGDLEERLARLEGRE
jgi:hypothetical protein